MSSLIFLTHLTVSTLSLLWSSSEGATIWDGIVVVQRKVGIKSAPPLPSASASPSLMVLSLGLGNEECIPDVWESDTLSSEFKIYSGILKAIYRIDSREVLPGSYVLYRLVDLCWFKEHDIHGGNYLQAVNDMFIYLFFIWYVYVDMFIQCMIHVNMS